MSECSRCNYRENLRIDKQLSAKHRFIQIYFDWLFTKPIVQMFCHLILSLRSPGLNLAVIFMTIKCGEFLRINLLIIFYCWLKYLGFGQVYTHVYLLGFIGECGLYFVDLKLLKDIVEHNNIFQALWLNASFINFKNVEK